MKPNIRSILQPTPNLNQTRPGNTTVSLREAKVIEPDAVSDVFDDEEGEEGSPLPRHSITKPSSTLDKPQPNSKRKRKSIEDDLEGRYMDQLAKQQLEEEKKTKPVPKKRREHHRSHSTTGDSYAPGVGDRPAPGGVDSASGEEEDTSLPDTPQRENVINPKDDLDLEESSRTVFLANVSTMAIKSKNAKKQLMDHLASFTSTLPVVATKHNIESLRFRSIAFANTGIPRKAAYAKKELMDTTTKSTNAYAVYTTQVAAREAVRKLNGTIVLDRHLRVDSVAHPAKTDHRRCVFVGNLGFVDDMTNMDAVEDVDNNKRPRKAKEPADIEEGLWRHFGKAGTVESVRVVRDKTTRVGKGFAYVQFEVLPHSSFKTDPQLMSIFAECKCRRGCIALQRKEISANATTHPQSHQGEEHQEGQQFQRERRNNEKEARPGCDLQAKDAHECAISNWSCREATWSCRRSQS